MGNSLSWKQALAFFMIFVPALIFYALQKNSFRVEGSTILGPPSHWLQETYDVFTQQLQETLNVYISLVGTNKENKKLKVENAQLASKLQLLEEYRSENIRLRDLFKFKQEVPRNTLAARVIAKDIISDQNSILIDKGTEDGVKRFQGVISAKGVVGYVVEVEAHSSRVLLLTDRAANVDAIVQRTRARGIISGKSNSIFQLKYLGREDDAEVGDLVITSGRQGYFPKGFVVGTITQFGPSPTGVSYQAEIAPSVPIDRLEDILVIIEHKVDEQPEETTVKE